MVIESSQHTSYSEGITLPITAEFHQIAQKFAQQCPFQEKASQIKQNTLAVCVVNAYLQLMEVETQVGQSDSWNPLMQMMTDVADLNVPGAGVFVCRPISAEAAQSGNPSEISTCYVPPEAWHNRAGYVAVSLNEAANEATILGFAATVGETEEVSLDRFAPIEALLETIHSLKNSEQTSEQTSTQTSAQTTAQANLAAQILSESQAAVTRLGQWWEGAIASSWESLENLIQPDSLNLAFRTGDSVETSSAARNATDISRAKLVDLGLQLNQSLQVALVMHLAPAGDNRSDITIQVRPLGESSYLPEGISLSILDENDVLFRSATSRAIDNYIQLQIVGESTETFSIQIDKDSATFRERFAI
jgi:hypothetical protein